MSSQSSREVSLKSNTVWQDSYPAHTAADWLQPGSKQATLLAEVFHFYNTGAFFLWDSLRA